MTQDSNATHFSSCPLKESKKLQALTIYDSRCFMDVVPASSVPTLAGFHINDDVHHNEGLRTKKPYT